MVPTYELTTICGVRNSIPTVIIETKPLPSHENMTTVDYRPDFLKKGKTSMSVGGTVTVGSGGTLIAGGISISTVGLATGTATVTYGCTVVTMSASNFGKDYKKMKQASGKMSGKEITEAAKKLGFEKTNYRSHGQAVYYNKKTRKYISYDVDNHNGGVWKMADLDCGENMIHEKMNNMISYAY